MRHAMLLTVPLAFAAASAHAKQTGEPAGFVIRYPSGDAPDPATLQVRMSDPSVSAIVFEKGTHVVHVQPRPDVFNPLFVFKRNDLTLCGATGDPKDVILESSARAVFQVEQAQGTVFRGLTIRCNFDPPPGVTGGLGVFLNAVPDATREGFVDRTRIERCDLDAYVGVQASVRTSELTVTDSRFVSRAIEPGSASGGVGLLWEDGPNLFVTRSAFTTARGVSAIAAIFVHGAQAPTSAGDRARQVFITRNSVSGDYSAGLDLADVKDAIVRQNRIRFPDTVGGGARGRVGIVVRRAAATQFTEDFELSQNTVRKAHYAVWLVGTGAGTCARNDFRGCGSETEDSAGPPGFSDHGGAVRVNLLGGACQTTFTSNDFRGLRSPVESAAVVLVPVADACTEAENPGNRTDRGRAVFGGAEP